MDQRVGGEHLRGEVRWLGDGGRRAPGEGHRGRAAAQAHGRACGARARRRQGHLVSERPSQPERALQGRPARHGRGHHGGRADGARGQGERRAGAGHQRLRQPRGGHLGRRRPHAQGLSARSRARPRGPRHRGQPRPRPQGPR